MANQLGVASGSYAVTASFPIAVTSAGPGRMYAGMDITSYVQFPYTVDNTRTFSAAASFRPAVEITATVNGTTVSIKASIDQGIYRWDSGTNGAWVTFGSISVGDWVLTDVLNTSYSDYFWQVTNVKQTTYSGDYYKIQHTTPLDAGYHSILCSSVSTGPYFAVRTY